MRYITKTFRAKYWLPGTNFFEILLEFSMSSAKDNDFIIISEKAISTALGRLVNEEKIIPSFSAKCLTKFWMRKIWGYFISVIARINRLNTERIRKYPLKEGAAHKQTVLTYCKPIYALKNFSEGGIDVSNLPYKYASLPLTDAQEIAEKISSLIFEKTGINLIIMITDSDKTFSLKSIHFSSRPTFVKRIYNIGPIAYVIGRFFKMRARSTPIAISKNIEVEEALRISAISNKARKFGAGRTAWDVATRFGTKMTDVSWDMLKNCEHRPIVIVRKLID
jgi:F420-0:gamma-glutamyl ligase-like protein